MDDVPVGVPTAAGPQRPLVTGDRPAYLTEPGPPLGLGQPPPRCELAGLTQTQTPTLPTGEIERDAAGRAVGRTARGGDETWSAGFVPAPRPRPTLVAGRVLDGPAAPARARRQPSWQDAIMGRLALMPDFFDAYPGRGRRRAADRTGATARCGGTASAAREQIDELRRAPRARTASAGYRPTSVKMMQDGIAGELHRRRCSSPYLDRLRPRRRRTRGLSHDRARRRSGDYVTALDALGFQVHVHAHRRPRGPRGARRRRGRAARQRPRAIPARTSRTSRSIHPDDVGRFGDARRHRQRCSRSGPAHRAADGRPHHPVPRGGAGRDHAPLQRLARPRAREYTVLTRPVRVAGFAQGTSVRNRYAAKIIK